MSVAVESSEIERASLHVAIPWYRHLYTFPFLSLYPLLAYAYYVKYDEWLVSEEWTFLACTSLGAGHALSFLITKWNAGARAWITTTKARSLTDADCIRIVPKLHQGQGDIVPLLKKDPNDPATYTFNYQRDTYVVSKHNPLTFARLPYPSSGKLQLSTFLAPKGLTDAELPAPLNLYGGNEFDIPTFVHRTRCRASYRSIFCLSDVLCCSLVSRRVLYCSLFTLFMLIVFECTVVRQVCTLYLHFLSN